MKKTGQEAFKEVLYILSAVSNNEIDTNCETIKTIEKSLKALEIIKEKNVDIRWIEVCDTVKDYNKGRDEHLNYELTKEEFNLLKGILNEE